MDVILRQDVDRLGAKGATVHVKDGYARNFLFPRGLAAPATAEAVRRMAAEQQAVATRVANERAYLEHLKDALGKKSLTIPMAAGPDDQLFGSVTRAHIAATLKQEGVDIDKRKIELPESIAALGVYHVPVHLSPDVVATLNVWVVKQ